MNAVLFDRVAGSWHIGGVARRRLVHANVGLFSEAALLFVAAQAGFVDGPRVMANMAVDSWLPHRFAALSERLSMQNGVLLMGGTSIAALLYTHGDVSKLVVMYSINVFLTFSLSNLGMSRFWITDRKKHPDWLKHLPVHLIGLALCVTILDRHLLREVRRRRVAHARHHRAPRRLCFAIRSHYRTVVEAIRRPRRRAPRSARGPQDGGRADRGRIAASAPGRRRDRPRASRSRSSSSAATAGSVGTRCSRSCGCSRTISRGSSSARSRSSTRATSKASKRCTSSRSGRGRSSRSTCASPPALGLPAESAFATGIEVAVEAEKLGKRAHRALPAGALRRRPAPLRRGLDVQPHPPQRDRVSHPAPPAARRHPDGRPPGPPRVGVARSAAGDFARGGDDRDVGQTAPRRSTRSDAVTVHIVEVPRLRRRPARCVMWRECR